MSEVNQTSEIFRTEATASRIGPKVPECFQIGRRDVQDPGPYNEVSLF